MKISARSKPPKISKGIQRLIKSRLLCGPSVELTVGPDEVKFTIPALLLRYFSKYFQSELKRKSDLVHLRKFPDHDQVAFTKVVTWLYTGNLNTNVILDKDSLTEVNTDQIFKTFDDMSQRIAQLCNIYIIAERLILEPLMDQALAEIEESSSFATIYSGHLPLDPWQVTHIWENTPADSRLRGIVYGMVVSFSTQLPTIRGFRVFCEEWTEFFKECEGLQTAITDAAVNRIRSFWLDTAEEDYLGGSRAFEEDEGRPSGWYSGPY